MAAQYLERGGIPAITLALSQHGGVAGERKFPLLRHHESWNALANACISAIQDNSKQNASNVFTVLEGASTSASGISTEVLELIFRVCSAAKDHWNREKVVLSANLVVRFSVLCERCGRYVPSPLLETSWRATCSRLTAETDAAFEEPYLLSGEALAEWISFIAVINAHEPRLISKGSLIAGFDSTITAYIEAMNLAIQEEIDDGEDADDLQSHANRFSKLSSITSSLEQLFPLRAKDLDSLADKLQEHAESLEERAEERSQDQDTDSDYEHEGPSRSNENSFDVEALFEDLCRTLE